MRPAPNISANREARSALGQDVVTVKWERYRFCEVVSHRLISDSACRFDAQAVLCRQI